MYLPNQELSSSTILSKMVGETNLSKLLQNIQPQLQEGSYVFVTLESIDQIPRADTLCEFKEQEGITLVLEQGKADELEISYDYVSAWITLKVHSALEAVGLTAAFATALTEHNISCNVIAGYFHDHIFVGKNDAEKAVEVLKNLAR